MNTLQRLAIPISIVVAGAIIALAVLLSGGGTNPLAQNSGGQAAQTVEIPGVQEDDYILGSPDAEIFIVEYSDPECPFCKQFHQTLNSIVEEFGADGEVAWVYRHFPLAQLHRKAPKEAEAFECAAKQGGNNSFWDYANLLFEITPSNDGLDIGVYNPGNNAEGTNAGALSEIAESIGLNVEKFEACLASGEMAGRVQADFDEVTAAGGRGTPHSFVLVDGEQIPVEGAQPLSVMGGLIETIMQSR